MERYDEAEPLFLEALDVYETALGKDHFLYAISIWGLAESHWKQGSFVKAALFFDQLVPALVKSQGKDHPDTVDARRRYNEFLEEKTAAGQ